MYHSQSLSFARYRWAALRQAIDEVSAAIKTL